MEPSISSGITLNVGFFDGVSAWFSGIVNNDDKMAQKALEVLRSPTTNSSKKLGYINWLSDGARTKLAEKIANTGSEIMTGKTPGKTEDYFNELQPVLSNITELFTGIISNEKARKSINDLKGAVDTNLTTVFDRHKGLHAEIQKSLERPQEERLAPPKTKKDAATRAKEAEAHTLWKITNYIEGFKSISLAAQAKPPASATAPKKKPPQPKSPPPSRPPSRAQ